MYTWNLEFWDFHCESRRQTTLGVEVRCSRAPMKMIFYQVYLWSSIFPRGRCDLQQCLKTSHRNSPKAKSSTSSSWGSSAQGQQGLGLQRRRIRPVMNMTFPCASSAKRLFWCLSSHSRRLLNTCLALNRQLPYNEKHMHLQ